MNGITIFSIYVLLYITVFGLGFVIGKVTAGLWIDQIDAKSSFFKPILKNKKVVEIDEKTFVTDITTNKLTKKGADLGTQVIVNDDVGTSVSKLSQFKKNT